MVAGGHPLPGYRIVVHCDAHLLLVQRFDGPLDDFTVSADGRAHRADDQPRCGCTASARRP